MSLKYPYHLRYLMRPVQWFFKAVLAGMMISIGAIVLLETINQCGPEFRWVGAILFSIGLYAVVLYGLNLYTGKVGYILENDGEYLVQVLITIVGNFVGCLIMGYLFPIDSTIAMCQSKLGIDLIPALAKGIMCGLLMYIAVDTYKEKGTPLAIFLAVPVFILAGFEHSIADMFYFFSAGMMWSVESLTFIGVILVGNLIGCCLLPAYRLYIEPIGQKDQ